MKDKIKEYGVLLFGVFVGIFVVFLFWLLSGIILENSDKGCFIVVLSEKMSVNEIRLGPPGYLTVDDKKIPKSVVERAYCNSKNIWPPDNKGY